MPPERKNPDIGLDMKHPHHERIGILGGTFNPPHLGHLIIAEQARVSYQLTKVIFMPAFLPPHKLGREIVDSRDRLEMTRLAIRGNKWFEVSNREIRRAGISYTVETLRDLHSGHPGAEFFLIMGSDNIAEYHTWKEPDQIRTLAQVLVYPRGGGEQSERRVEFLKGVELAISSTDIRGRVARGESIRYLVPSAVERYIKLHRLYLSSK